MANLRAMVTVAAMACALPSNGHADPETPPVETSTVSAAPMAERDFHIGLNFRTDFGTHYDRIDFGVRRKKWDFVFVADPLGIPKGDYDFDAIVRHGGDRWSWWGGARLSMTPIARDTQFTEKALVGVSAELPRIYSDKVRIHSGLELAVHLHSHGAGVMTRWVCVDSPDCREDHFVFSLFGRVEYATPF